MHLLPEGEIIVALLSTGRAKVLVKLSKNDTSYFNMKDSG